MPASEPPRQGDPKARPRRRIAPDDPPRPGVVDRRGTAPRQLADEPSVEAGAKQADEQVGARYLREMERTATVVGGGIAGLATALGLSRTGWDVRLVERDAEPRAVGAGLTLWPNALRALDALGVGDGVRDVSHVISRTVIRRADGNVITELPVDRIAAQWGPLVTVHRPDLHGVLLDAFPGDRVFGSAATVDGGLVVVDGAETTTTLVVGADGIGSVVRGALVGPVVPRPTGQIAVRGVADT